MSSAAASPDGMGLQSHYSLRWNNHQAHILQAFEALLHAELLVDVTLVCAETSLRAHKVVLSVCSPFFERIFAEHPCKHPVIVLKDFPGREIAALIDFMYRGEVRVGREDLPGLMHAAESLQIRGLASSEPRPVSPPETPTTDMLLDEPSTPEGARQMLLDSSHATEDDDLDLEAESVASLSLPLLSGSRDSLFRDHRLSSAHVGQTSYHMREGCSSPLLPRRKQARPRRRSGELIPQDLSRPHPPPSLSPPSTGLNLSSSSSNNNNNNNISTNNNNNNNSNQRNNNSDAIEIDDDHENNNQQPQQKETQLPQLQQPQHSPSSQSSRPPSQQQQQQQQVQQPPQQQEQEEEAENLSMKRELKRSLTPSTDHHLVKSESEAASSPRGSPMTSSSGLQPDTSFTDLPPPGLTAMSSLSLTPPHHHSSEYLASLGQFAAQWLPPNHHNHHLSGGGIHPRHPRDDSPHGKPPPGFPPFPPSDSPLAPRNPFPMDGMPPLGGSAGLFPPGGPLDLHDSFKPESFHGLFMGAASLGHHHPGKKSKKHRGDGIHRRWSDHARGLPLCRPKGQHSAPRGGPPRSWTNADLTEALTMVWNKKMTTSQASRVYGIPYNSLLMYVRGKYGKSLKLEQLRRDCVAGEVMNSLNNNVKPLEPPPPGSRLPGLSGLPHPGDADPNFAHHPLLGGSLGQGFFPDFGNFPMPVNMVHLLPPSEQKAFEPPTNPQPGNNSASNGLRGDDLAKSRSPSPMNVSGGSLHDSLMPPPAQSAPALLQQNGSD